MMCLFESVVIVGRRFVVRFLGCLSLVGKGWVFIGRCVMIFRLVVGGRGVYGVVGRMVNCFLSG